VSLRNSIIRVTIAASLMLLLAMPSAAMLHFAPDARAYSGITIDLEHPVFAGKDQTVQCKLTIAGGPASDLSGNFSYKITITGKNTTGSATTPSSGTSLSGIWSLNITMPSRASQTIKIKVNASSKNVETKEIKYLENEFEVKVVDPIVIRAEIFNNGPVAALNVTAKFFADGVLLDTQVFDLSANSSTALIYNWTFMKINGGKHVITVSVDDAGKVVEFSNGNNVFSRTIYVEQTSNPIGGVLTIAVIILSVFVGLMYLQKPQRRKK
jgi:hypothetical protein